MEQNEAYQRAKKRVEAKIGFYRHLTSYLFINAVLLVINLIASPETLWFYWPLIFWGIGLASHALSVFGPASHSTHKKEKMIEDEMRRQEAKTSGADKGEDKG